MPKYEPKADLPALVATLQSPADSETRLSACETLLATSREAGGCSALCAAGAVQAVLHMLKALEAGALLKLSLQLLSNLSRFDAKLVSVVWRVQGGVSALLEAVRTHLQSSDSALLEALLGSLAEVTASPLNAQLLAKENGVAVLLAVVLTHLKSGPLLLQALQPLVAISRAPRHAMLLVKEGGVPALLAVLLAHLRSPELLRPALTVLRNVVLDTDAAMRLSGHSATTIVHATLQASAQ